MKKRLSKKQKLPACSGCGKRIIPGGGPKYATPDGIQPFWVDLKSYCSRCYGELERTRKTVEKEERKRAKTAERQKRFREAHKDDATSVTLREANKVRQALYRERMRALRYAELSEEAKNYIKLFLEYEKRFGEGYSPIKLGRGLKELVNYGRVQVSSRTEN